EKEQKQTEEAERIRAAKQPENIMKLIEVDILEIDLGFMVAAALTDRSQPGNIVDRSSMVRRQIATELGDVMPSIHSRDNAQLGPTQYTIRLKGVEIANYDLEPEMYLVLGDQAAISGLEGKPTTEPAFKLPAKWVRDRSQAESMGLAVIDAPTVLTTHL